MAADYQRLAQAFSDVTLAVGNAGMGVKDALEALESTTTACCELTDLTELWQVALRSNDVLRILYPEHTDFFASDDPRTPGQETIALHISTKVVIRLVLIGVKHLDKNPRRQEAAVELLNAYPSPIPPSDTPFKDEKGLWDHTHGRAE